MNATEEVEQRIVVDYCELKGYKFTSIPNATYTKSWNQKRKNREQGLRPGFPDLVIIAGNKFMAVEMKRLKGGQVTAHQKEWIEALNDAGIPAKVCRGSDEAIKFIEQTRRGK